MKKWFYELVYRLVPAERIFGATSRIEDFVDKAITGRISGGDAITLGCGVGRETIYLAKKGFDVTGVDFSPRAIGLARRNAARAGLEIRFMMDDLTGLKNRYSAYDLVMDFGALNDLSRGDRDRYMRNVLPLTKAGKYYVMFAFTRMLPVAEVMQRFEKNFKIEIIHEGPGNRYPGGLNLYFMTRKKR